MIDNITITRVEGMTVVGTLSFIRIGSFYDFLCIFS